MSWLIGIAMLVSSQASESVTSELVTCTSELEQAIGIHKANLPYWLVTADEEIRAVVLGMETRKSNATSLVRQYEQGHLGGAGLHLLSNGVDDCRKTLADFRRDSFWFRVLAWGGMGLLLALTLSGALAMFWPFLPWRPKHESTQPPDSSPDEDGESEHSSSRSSSLRL